MSRIVILGMFGASLLVGCGQPKDAAKTQNVPKPNGKPPAVQIRDTSSHSEPTVEAAAKFSYVSVNGKSNDILKVNLNVLGDLAVDATAYSVASLDKAEVNGRPAIPVKRNGTPVTAQDQSTFTEIERGNGHNESPYDRCIAPINFKAGRNAKVSALDGVVKLEVPKKWYIVDAMANGPLDLPVLKEMGLTAEIRSNGTWQVKVIFPKKPEGLVMRLRDANGGEPKGYGSGYTSGGGRFVLDWSTSREHLKGCVLEIASKEVQIVDVPFSFTNIEK